MIKRMNQDIKDELLKYLLLKFGTKVTIPQIKEASKFVGCKYTQTLFMRDEDARVDRGIYRVPKTHLSKEAKQSLKKKTDLDPKSNTKKAKKNPTLISSDINSYVPEKAEGYIKFGYYNRIKTLVKSKEFFPAFITGLSGNGKTEMVLQVCAELKRECIRINFTEQTDEDDLLGGFRLLDGETVFSFGGVVEAMMRGAILLLDEIDLSSYKVMCLQPVLEGKGIYLKKINKYVSPAPGFNVIATANTKGRGSDDGKFVGTNLLNEAFLERFASYYEQSYPTKGVETRILNLQLKTKTDESKKFVKDLTAWAANIRKTYYAGSATEIITTRRLIYIINDYNIFDDRIEAVKMQLARFSESHKEDLMRLFLATSGDSEEEKEEVSDAINAQEVPAAGVSGRPTPTLMGMTAPPDGGSAAVVHDPLTDEEWTPGPGPDDGGVELPKLEGLQLEDLSTDSAFKSSLMLSQERAAAIRSPRGDPYEKIDRPAKM